MTNAIDLTPAELRELAHLLEQLHPDPELTVRRRLSAESVQELAAMLAAGRQPTIGWWRQHGSKPSVPSATHRAPSMAAVTKTAHEMCMAGWPEEVVVSGVTTMAIDDGRARQDAAEATARGIAKARIERRRHAS
jgi:hypothetical protein